MQAVPNGVIHTPITSKMAVDMLSRLPKPASMRQPLSPMPAQPQPPENTQAYCPQDQVCLVMATTPLATHHTIFKDLALH